MMRGRHAINADLRNRWRRYHRRDVAHAERFAQLLGALVGLQSDGVVGLHAQHEVDAPLQVQTELELLLLHPAGRRDVVIRREDRIDADAREDHQHGDNRDEFPANVLVHDEPLPSEIGACP
jgi:hypothetical protein